MAEFEKALDGEKIQEMSTKDDEESVGAVKTVACDMLLQHRVELNFKNRKVTSSKKRFIVNSIRFLLPLNPFAGRRRVEPDPRDET